MAIAVMFDVILGKLRQSDAPAGGAIGGMGTVNRYAKFTAPQTIGDGLMSDDGLNVYQTAGSLFFVNNQGIDVVATGGADVLNIGTANADIINIGWSGADVNVIGDVFYQNVTELQVKDKLFTVNKGGAAASGSSAGFEIEEGGVATGWFMTNGARTGWLMKPPATFEAQFLMSALTGNQIYTLPDVTGTFLIGAGTANYVTKYGAVSGSLAASQIFDDGSFVGINNAAPSVLFHVKGTDNALATESVRFQGADGTKIVSFFNNGSWRVTGNLDLNLNSNNPNGYQLLAQSTASAGLAIDGTDFSQIRFFRLGTPAAAFQMIGLNDFRMYFEDFSLVRFSTNITQLYKNAAGQFLFSPLGTGIIVPANAPISSVGITSDSTSYVFTAYDSGANLLFAFRNDGNLGIGTTTFGTNAAKVLAMFNGTAPTTSPADTFQMWATDIEGAAGKSGAHLRSEDGSIHAFGDFHYFGDPSTNGSWRIGISAANFVIAKREAGVWVVKDTILA